MFKFGTIGAYKQVRNNPRCEATSDVYVGQVVLPDDSTGNAPIPSTETEAQGDVWVVGNIIDKPETLNSVKYQVKTGEKVRAFYVKDLVELPVELDYRVITTDYSELSVGDILVADTDGKWVVADGTSVIATDYSINIEIIEKTTFGDNGIYGIVKVN